MSEPFRLNDFDDDVRKLPRCCVCDKPIEDDYLYDLMGALYCEECMRDRYREPVERYIHE